MSDTYCTFRGERDHALVAYLYDDIGAPERAEFDAHLAVCAACREELAELGAVRGGLARWAPPEPRRAPDTIPTPRPGIWARLHEMPAWARVAAAVLVVGVSAGVANLDVTYDGDALSLRTGWSPRVSSGAAAAAADPAATAAAERLWRAELAAFEERMREELRAATTSSAANAARPGDEATLARVRALLAASEERQQRELALRVAEVVRDVQGWRRADLERIDRSLGVIQSSTGVEMMRNRQLLNNLAVRVSQRP
jgi:hypothetical protein